MNKVLIYIWTYCPYCMKAIDLLNEKNIEYDVEIMDGKEKELAELKARTGHNTVPQIFIGNTFIGGFTELEELQHMGELDELLGI